MVEYIIAGTGTLTVNAREYHPSAGDFYLLQPGIAHEYHSSGDSPWTKIFANVYGPLCRKVVDLYGLSNTVHIKNCDVRRPLQELIDIANSLELKESEIMARCAAKFVEVIASASLYNSENIHSGQCGSESPVRLPQRKHAAYGKRRGTVQFDLSLAGLHHKIV